jgi:uncharacterized protein with HEPN domain
MRRESKKYLYDIQQSCERISKFISGKNYQTMNLMIYCDRLSSVNLR